MSQNSIRKLLLFLLVLLTPLSSYFIYWISSSMLEFYKAVEAKPSYITSIILGGVVNSYSTKERRSESERQRQRMQHSWHSG